MRSPADLLPENAGFSRFRTGTVVRGELRIKSSQNRARSTSENEGASGDIDENKGGQKEGISWQVSGADWAGYRGLGRRSGATGSRSSKQGSAMQTQK